MIPKAVSFAALLLVAVADGATASVIPVANASFEIAPRRRPAEWMRCRLQLLD